ncbi:hypothetical protein BH23GEM6_BH23GEM6_26720 [soil metagenome]
MPKTESSSTLRSELETQILHGRCAYCRRPAEPDQPLTREHVIPRARGGRRNDVRIIVPACLRCNNRRGCQELALFLILRPRRISAFLDYLQSLSAPSIQQMDLRVFGELYAAVWMLSECSIRGQEWRDQLRRMTGGRTLHRRRYAARRVVRETGGRLEQRRGRGSVEADDVALFPTTEPASTLNAQLDEPLEQLTARLLTLLSLIWQSSAREVGQEMARQLQKSSRSAEAESTDSDGTILPLDGWKPRANRNRRFRFDRRRGRAA